MERRIKSLEDQLKVVQGKKSAKKVKGDGTKKTPPEILKNKDTPVANKKKSTPKSIIPPNPGVNNSNTARTKGTKKKGGRKYHSMGRRPRSPQNLANNQSHDEGDP
jgi:hypothetical protein